MHALQPKDRKTMNKGWRGVERGEMGSIDSNEGLMTFIKLKCLPKKCICRKVHCGSGSALQGIKLIYIYLYKQKSKNIKIN